MVKQSTQSMPVVLTRRRQKPVCEQREKGRAGERERDLVTVDAVSGSFELGGEMLNIRR